MIKSLPGWMLLTCIFITSLANSQSTELWGTTNRAGADNLGRIVRVSSSGSFIGEAHSFPATYPGSAPNRTHLVVYNNAFYGVTYYGGKYANGVLFKYDPATNISTKLYDFSTASGINPVKNLCVYNNKLYGITASGGANNFGTIFEFDPATNVYTKKFDLTAATGSMSSCGLTVAGSKLYGITGSGAANNFGALIEYDPIANTCLAKANCTNDATVGRVCFGGMILFNSKLYGAMRFTGNGGTAALFEYDPATSTYTIKYHVQPTDPRDYTGGFATDGNLLYAATNQGPGMFSNSGAIIEFNPVSGTVTTKYSFSYATGGGSFGDLFYFNNKFYGTNTIGGSAGVGAVFEWDPVTNTITKQASVALPVGDQPTAGFNSIGGKLYTTCLNGGAFQGTFIEWDLAVNQLIKKFNFGESKGASISTRLVSHAGKVYGVTSSGGTFNKGVLFSKDIASGIYTVLYNFNTSTIYDVQSFSQLIVYNNKVYGIANKLTGTSFGAIFEWDIATSTFTQRYALTNAGGYEVTGSFLLHSNNRFYGISKSGGTNSSGTVFSWDPATNVFTNHNNIAGFPNINGGFVSYGGLFYALSSNGGSSSNGGILTFNPTTNALTNVYSFNNGSTGGYPTGEFSVLNNKLYTATSSGGNNFGGVIIEFDPATNNVTPKYHLSATFPESPAATGSQPNGVLLEYNGELYGFTSAGAANGSGSTFRYNPTTNIFTKIEDIIPVGSSTQSGNGFIAVQGMSILPVQGLSFTAEKMADARVQLNWKTLTEENNLGFKIERSADGNKFINIGWVAAKNSSDAKYNFIDANPLKGKNFYRLVQEDKNGRQTTSAVRLINFASTENSLQLMPNPFHNSLRIDYSGTKAALLILCNASGVIVHQSLVQNGTSYLNLDKLPAGIVFYQLTGEDGNNKSGTIIKQ